MEWETFFPWRIHGTGICTYIYHTNQPNVGKYTIHGWYGFELSQPEKTIDCRWFYRKPTVRSQIETPFAESYGTSICVFFRKTKLQRKKKKTTRQNVCHFLPIPTGCRQWWRWIKILVVTVRWGGIQILETSINSSQLLLTSWPHHIGRRKGSHTEPHNTWDDGI